MKWPLQKIFIHTLCWIAFALLPIIVSPDFSFFGTWQIGRPDIRNFISSLLMIPFFYANYYWFIPEFYHKKKYLSFAAISVLCFAAITILPAFVMPEHWGGLSREPHHPMMPPPMEIHNMPLHKPHHNWMIPFQLESNFLKFMIIFVLSVLLKVRELWIEAQNEKKATELSYLKLQVNPHFLFNTLNSIYSLSLEKSDKTPSAIVKLSELMRYVTTEVSADFVPLSKEVKYISNYIELQRIRLVETATIDFLIEGETESQMIAPLLLIPFIENAFKFGVNPEESSLIRIHLTIKEKQLALSVYNRKVKPDHNMQSDGTGLKNVRQRLELIYPDSHMLSIQDLEKEFTVQLTLQLI